MPIVDYADGNTQEYRAVMLDDIRRKKAADPNFIVVDIGGRLNPWADDMVDVYVDVFEFETDKRLYVGDVNSEDIWRQLEADGPFDFVIISHVLEDIRDPMTGLKWLPRVAKAGFLGLPVKHREVANSKSGYWLGQSHHYWIFGVKNDDNGDPILMVVPKVALRQLLQHQHSIHRTTRRRRLQPWPTNPLVVRPRKSRIRPRTRRHLGRDPSILGPRLHPHGPRADRTAEDGLQRWHLIGPSRLRRRANRNERP